MRINSGSTGSKMRLRKMIQDPIPKSNSSSIKKISLQDDIIRHNSSIKMDDIFTYYLHKANTTKPQRQKQR